jgi:hypothetical protein
VDDCLVPSFVKLSVPAGQLYMRSMKWWRLALERCFFNGPTGLGLRGSGRTGLMTSFKMRKWQCAPLRRFYELVSSGLTGSAVPVRMRLAVASCFMLLG